MKQEVPHPHVMDKNWEGYLKNEVSQLHTRPPSSVFQCQEDKPPELLAGKQKQTNKKTSEVWGNRGNCGILRCLLFKGLQQS